MSTPDAPTPAEGGRLTRLIPGAALVALCVGLLVLYVAYPTYPNYDSYYGLLWARELWDGQRPVFDAFRAPTQHPLSILYGLVLVPFGTGANRFLVVCSLASIAALAAGMYQLGRLAFNRPVGLVAGALLVVNWDLILLAVRGYLDITYMALVVWAAVLEVRRPRRGALVMAILVMAALLRPEAWVLTGLYGLWMAIAPGPTALPRAIGDVVAALRPAFTRRGLAWLAVGIVAPVAWMATDLVVTGDPLYSQTHTSGLAEELGRTRGPLEMPLTTFAFLKGINGLPLFLAGLVGMIGAAIVVPRRIALPLVLWIIGIATFLAIGVGGFSVIDRYLLVPAVLLLVFAAFALVGWTMLPGGGLRRAWSLLAILAGVGVVVVGATRIKPGSIDNDLTFRSEAHADLFAVLDDPAVDRARRCGPVWTPNHKLVPDARWALDAGADEVLPRTLLRSLSEQEPGEVVDDQSPDRAAARREVPSAPAKGAAPTKGVLIVPNSRQSLIRHALVIQPFDQPGDAVPLPGFRRIAVGEYYAAYARC
ncbi:MAG: hypothetical protein M0P31_08145 [Solirubrobacteraceae bacterium]|nr:hypothetical protein [Solirubrobacteraceae bacterium]